MSRNLNSINQMQPDISDCILKADENDKSRSILKCKKGSYYIGSNELVNPIATGSFGIIYKATTATEMIVAIKKIPLSGTDVKNIVNEINAMQEFILHKNIVSILDYGFDSISYYIVMKFYESGSLTKLINSNTEYKDPLNIIEHFRQICYGLKQIHDSKSIHRDLKTDNILIEKNQCPYCCAYFKQILSIGDFGLAKQMTSSVNMTINVGTAYTKAPEVYTSDYGIKADIYSLGCIFYKMIFEKEPFTGSNECELLENKKNGLNPKLLEASIRERFPKFKNPELFLDILIKCLEPDAVKRWGPTELYDKMKVDTLYTQRNNLADMQNFQKLLDFSKSIKMKLIRFQASMIGEKLKCLNLRNGEIFKKYHQLMKTLYLINDYINKRIRMQSTVELFKTSLTRKELLMDQMCQVKKSLHSVIEAVTTSNHLRYHSQEDKVLFCQAYEILFAIFITIAMFALYSYISIVIKK